MVATDDPRPARPRRPVRGDEVRRIDLERRPRIGGDVPARLRRRHLVRRTEQQTAYLPSGKAIRLLDDRAQHFG